MRGVFFPFFLRNKIKIKKLLLVGSSSEAATPTSRSPEIWIAGRVLEEAGGIGSDASRLSANQITCRNKKEREDEEENGREAPCVTPVEA